MPLEKENGCGKFFAPDDSALGLGDYRLQMLPSGLPSDPKFGLKVLTSVIFDDLGKDEPIVDYYEVGLSGHVFFVIHTSRKVYEEAKACLPLPG